MFLLVLFIERGLAAVCRLIEVGKDALDWPSGFVPQPAENQFHTNMDHLN